MDDNAMEAASISVVSGTAGSAVRIQPGEQTTEHALTTEHNLQATILQVLAGLIASVSGLIDLAEWLPQTHTTLRIITIGGIALVGLKQICKTIATIRYTDGRSMIKANAAGQIGPGGDARTTNGLLLALGCLLLAAPAPAYAMLNAEVKPDAIAHVEAGAVQAPVTGTIQKDAVHVEKGAVSVHVDPDAVHAVIESGALHVSPYAIDAPLISSRLYTPVRVQPGAVQLSTQPNTFHIEKDAIHLEIIVPPNAIVVHAEGATETAMKPLQEMKAAVLEAGTEARTYLWWIAIGGVTVGVVAIVAAIAVHLHHMKQRAKLEQ
jgi:hypothetical protein